ncbi:MAG TPA: endolytic transglycosylase MltG [Fimbriimonadaceae bacterium]|nr:endolytic transglycosylase MltG [Fimbriimonadaceae bacterium]
MVILGLIGAGLYGNSRLAPMPDGPKQYYRVAKNRSLAGVLNELQSKGIVRDARVARWYARLKRAAQTVDTGTYQIQPGMTVDRLLKTLTSPIRRMVRIPETNLSYRTANLLEKLEVCSADEYKAIVADPKRLEEAKDLPLKEGANLEGYLFPDTYDLPPMMGAESVVRMQLKAFDQKVAPLLKDVKDWNRVLTIASLIELEAGTDKDRPLIASVIENRLAKNMRLQIDATLLYAISEWRRLTFKDYREIDSPYSTYKNSGLPPGPICSPSVASVKAALAPAKTDYFYYVAKPDLSHAFSTTYDEHLANIRNIRGPK